MPARKTILLTGPSGVIGNALLPRLAGYTVVCLTHRRPAAGRYEQLRGDLLQPRLGLSLREYADVVSRVDTVVHCAAVTGFAAGEQVTREVNVEGTKRICEAAVDAGSSLVYVSTAFVACMGTGQHVPGHAVNNPVHYLNSKRAAEELVRAAPVPWAIARPSVVIGDAVTGRIASLQALHAVAHAVARNLVPLVPVRPDARIDFIPSDTVARALAGIIEESLRGEFWLTGGTAALDAAAAFGVITHTARLAGLTLDDPRLVDPETVERLIRPVFLDNLPAATRRRFNELCAVMSFFANGGPFPSSLGELPGVQPLSSVDLAVALAATVDHVLAVKNLDRATVRVAA